MTKGRLVFCNTILAAILGILGGTVVFFLGAVLYIAAGEIVACFHWEIPIPSLITMNVVYWACVAAIDILAYRILMRAFPFYIRIKA